MFTRVRGFFVALAVGALLLGHAAPAAAATTDDYGRLSEVPVLLDVLFLRPLLVDVMVTRPPERGSARDRTWVSSSGEVTLIVELRDSLSGKLLARAADRRAVQGVGGYMERSISTNEIANVRRLFNSWARLLRQRLDASKDLAQTHD